MTTDKGTTQNMSGTFEDEQVATEPKSCPECGEHERFLDLIVERWGVYHAHRTKWFIGIHDRCWPDHAWDMEPELNRRILNQYTQVHCDPDWEDSDEGEGMPSTGGTEVLSLFDVGTLHATPGALRILTLEQIAEALGRHRQGDWGDVPEEDRRENDLSVKEGFRILSSYRSPNGTKFWVITEADRSVTTVLLPEEY